MRHLKEVAKEKTKLLAYMVVGLALVVFSSMALIFHLTGGEPPYSILFSFIIVELTLIMLGSIFIYDTIKRKHPMRSTNFGIGLFLAFFGAFPLLVDLKLLRFLPFTIDFSVNYILLAAILFFSSMYFVVDMFFGLFRK